ncbi:hypothetical protein TRIP_C30084 [Candidatus Zixiibacteriota bacterium]|nr:hypothetical protein TRIP_C30084 [candidate division Zixibacteria bacterium]
MEEHNFSENDLTTNLNLLSQEIIRELYMAAKKVAVYSAAHPLIQKTAGRPFFLIDKVFRFKRYFHLHISSGNLYALNIKIKPSVFTEQIMEYMTFLDITDITVASGITVQQLILFLERFARRLPAVDSQNLMAQYLEKHDIDCIKINGESGYYLFEYGKKFQGDVPGDFSVRGIVGNIAGDNFERLSDLLVFDNIGEEQYIRRFQHDYCPRLVRYLIPEKIATFSRDFLIAKLSDIFGRTFQQGIIETPDQAPPDESRRLQGFIQALNYHPEREEILSQLNNILSSRGVPRVLYNELLPAASVIKFDSSGKIDEFLDTIFNKSYQKEPLENFQDYYSRLLRTGQQGKANSVITLLIEYLASDDLDARRNALALLHLVLDSSRQFSAIFLVEHITERIDEYITSGRETFEFAELLWDVAQVYVGERQYARLAGLCRILEKKCQRVNGIPTFESIAVKKAVSDLNRREIINQLIWELMEGQGGNFADIKTILVTIGSEEAAFALSTIISHQSRQVRQYVLKILSEFGKAAVNVFARIMDDNKNFEREPDRKELPDEKWYLIRNSIFVIGALQDKEGCSALRLRISDPDSRVRREIITALEKIGGEEAADLLMILAEDSDREVREAAVIAIGLIGRQEIVPELIDLALRNHSEIIRLIGTLGKLGGEQARKFLSDILTDVQLQSALTGNRSSREELKLATLKALGKIGDKASLEKIKEFTDSLSSSQKVFFGGSKLGKVAEGILNRHES